MCEPQLETALAAGEGKTEQIDCGEGGMEGL